MNARSSKLRSYSAGKPWWLETRALVEEAAGQQADRCVKDPWHTEVVAFLDGPDVRKRVTVSEVLGTDGLGIDKASWTQVEQNRVARILKSLGWSRKQKRSKDDGKREWRYFRPGTGDGEECHE